MQSNVVNINEFGIREERFEEQAPVWAKFYAAMRNDLIMNALAIGREKHKVNDETIWSLILDAGDGIRVIIPMEYTIAKTSAELLEFIGDIVYYKVVKIDEENKLVIGNQASAMEHRKEITLKKLNEGDIVPAKIKVVTDYNLYVDIEGIITKIPKRKLVPAYENLKKRYKKHEYIDVRIAEVNREEKTVTVEPMLEDPFSKVGTEFNVGNDYLGQVVHTSNKGFFIEIAPMLSVFCHYHTSFRFRYPKVGDRVIVRLQRIDHEKRMLYGDLKRYIDN